MKLDLGCGAFPLPGFEGVDFFSESARHKVNLLQVPWPWADSNVDALVSRHFLEHVPMVYVGKEGQHKLVPDHPDDRDLLARMMDEAWRILKPGGTFEIHVPSATSADGFRDPTHRRFFVQESFWYFDKSWREARGLGHYICSCDFEVKVWPMIWNDVPEGSSPRHQWNIVGEWRALLTARK